MEQYKSFFDFLKRKKCDGLDYIFYPSVGVCSSLLISIDSAIAAISLPIGLIGIASMGLVACLDYYGCKWRNNLEKSLQDLNKGFKETDEE